MGRNRTRTLCTWLALALLVGPLPARRAHARRGTLAVVNIGNAGHEVAERAIGALRPHLGGWARQVGIEAYLAGRPHPGSLPVGDTGKDLVRLVERVRTRSASRGDLQDLGRLLGVDYLLLIRVRASTYVARLFSVHQGSYAPGQLEARLTEEGRLQQYVKAQATRGKVFKTSRYRWWVWGIAAAIAAVTIGLALAGRDERSGDLRVRVSR
jgi:hypothetical protein